MFSINQINADLVQIYGGINGIAFTKIVDGAKRWGFRIKFFKGSSLITVSSHERDGTISDLEKLNERIKKAYGE